MSDLSQTVDAAVDAGSDHSRAFDQISLHTIGEQLTKLGIEGSVAIGLVTDRNFVAVLAQSDEEYESHAEHFSTDPDDATLIHLNDLDPTFVDAYQAVAGFQLPKLNKSEFRSTIEALIGDSASDQTKMLALQLVHSHKAEALQPILVARALSRDFPVAKHTTDIKSDLAAYFLQQAAKLPPLDARFKPMLVGSTEWLRDFSHDDRLELVRDLGVTTWVANLDRVCRSCQSQAEVPSFPTHHTKQIMELAVRHSESFATLSFALTKCSPDASTFTRGWRKLHALEEIGAFEILAARHAESGDMSTVIAEVVLQVETNRPPLPPRHRWNLGVRAIATNAIDDPKELIQFARLVFANPEAWYPGVETLNRAFGALVPADPDVALGFVRSEIDRVSDDPHHPAWGAAYQLPRFLDYLPEETIAAVQESRLRFTPRFAYEVDRNNPHAVAFDKAVAQRMEPDVDPRDMPGFRDDGSFALTSYLSALKTFDPGAAVEFATHVFLNARVEFDVRRRLVAELGMPQVPADSESFESRASTADIKVMIADHFVNRLDESAPQALELLEAILMSGRNPAWLDHMAFSAARARPLLSVALYDLHLDLDADNPAEYLDFLIMAPAEHRAEVTTRLRALLRKPDDDEGALAVNGRLVEFDTQTRIDILPFTHFATNANDHDADNAMFIVRGTGYAIPEFEPSISRFARIGVTSFHSEARALFPRPDPETRRLPLDQRKLDAFPIGNEGVDFPVDPYVQTLNDTEIKLNESQTWTAKVLKCRADVLEEAHVMSHCLASNYLSKLARPRRHNLYAVHLEPRTPDQPPLTFMFKWDKHGDYTLIDANSFDNGFGLETHDHPLISAINDVIQTRLFAARKAERDLV